LTKGENIMRDFAKRLKTIRESKGITLYRLAQLTGLSKQGVINLEAENADPKLSTLVLLGKALHVPPWELVPGSPRSTPVGLEEEESTPVDRGGIPRRPVYRGETGKIKWAACRKLCQPLLSRVKECIGNLKKPQIYHDAELLRAHVLAMKEAMSQAADLELCRLTQPLLEECLEELNKPEIYCADALILNHMGTMQKLMCRALES
jgi:transcriptional regulator with XRE-family HTH domain